MTNGRCVFACFVAAVISMIATSRVALAQTPGCDALDAGQQRVKQEAFVAMHPYDGCDETFDRCLAKKPPAPVVLRLASDICRQIKAGKSRQEIERALAKRAQSMMPVVKPASFAMDEAAAVGDPKAPVRVVVYACARCPFCRVIVPALFKEVTEGSLKGKVRLYFRPFPLKDHAGSTEGGLAMIGAARLNKFWPMVTLMYERYDSFCPALLPEWAAEAGIDRPAFEKEIADPKNREALVISKQEGLRNKVEATPTVFIDGRKYVYELHREALVDVMLEACEAAAGKKP
jgi:protein-disulfide isomerase